MPSLAYLNGRFLPFAEASLPLHDAGFVSGATIVDNARTFRHKLFRWPDHLARFRRDCEACYVPLNVTDEQITAAAEELVEHNAKLLPAGGELQLVTFATPGPLGFYVGEQTHGPATLGMATYPLPFERYRRFFMEGATLAVAGVQSSGATDILPPTAKHRSRLFWYMADQKLKEERIRRPGAVAVVMDHNGIGDTAIGSILAAADDAIIRPAPGCVQDSISLKVIGELCRSLGIRCEEAIYDMRGLADPLETTALDTATLRITEILLAGTGFCVAGVRKFCSPGASRAYPWPGPVFQQLLAAWSDLVGVDIAAQMRGEI